MTVLRVRISVAGALMMMELVLGSAIICMVGFVEPSLCVAAPVVLGMDAGIGALSAALDPPLTLGAFEFPARFEAGLVLSNNGLVIVPMVVPTVPLKLACAMPASIGTKSSARK